MKSITKNRVVFLVAGALAFVMLLGVLAAFIPRGSPDNAEEHQTDGAITLSKLPLASCDSSTERITVAAFLGGRHIYAVDSLEESSTSYLVYSDDGEHWGRNNMRLGEIEQELYCGPIDELLYKDGTYYAAIYSRTGSGYGVVQQTKDLGSVYWENTLTTTSNNGGRRPMSDFGIIDGSLFVVTDLGALRYGTSSAHQFVDAFDTSIAEIGKIGSKYVALASDDNVVTVYTAKSMNGIWSKQVVGGGKANSIFFTDSCVYIACDDGVIYQSSDLNEWKRARVPDTDIDFVEVFFYGNKLYAIASGSESGCLYESNTGVAWECVVRIQESFVACSVAETEVFLYGDQGGIYRLTN